MLIKTQCPRTRRWLATASFLCVFSLTGSPAVAMQQVVEEASTGAEPTAEQEPRGTQQNGSPAGDASHAETETGTATEKNLDDCPELGVAVTSAPGKSVLVLEVVQGSPAQNADIRRGDFLLRLDGTAAETPTKLRDELCQMKAGSDVTITLWRDGNELEKTVTLVAQSVKADPGENAWLGIVMRTNAQGNIVVDRVVADSPAETAGLRAGDVILKQQGETVQQAQDVIDAVRAKRPGDELRLDIRRGDSEQQLTVRLAEISDAPMRMLERMLESGGPLLRDGLGGRLERFRPNRPGSEDSERAAPDALMDQGVEELRKRLKQLEEELRGLRGSGNPPSREGKLDTTQRRTTGSSVAAS